MNETFYSVLIKVDMSVVINNIINYLPYKDYTEQTIIFGSNQNMQGLIYSFEIFIEEKAEIIKETAEDCKIIPYFTNNCLNDCAFNQFKSKHK